MELADGVCRIGEPQRERRHIELVLVAVDAAAEFQEPLHVQARALEELPEAPITLQATIERKEMSECVQRFLVALPDDYRTVMMLAEIEGLTGAEISELLSVPLTTVKMRLHRARRMLQEELEAGCTFCCNEQSVLVCEPKR